MVWSHFQQEKVAKKTDYQYPSHFHRPCVPPPSPSCFSFCSMRPALEKAASTPWRRYRSWCQNSPETCHTALSSESEPWVKAIIRVAVQAD